MLIMRKTKIKYPYEQALQHPKYEYLQWYFPYFIFYSTMRAKRPGTNGNRGETSQGANGIRGETTRYPIMLLSHVDKTPNYRFVCKSH